MDWWQLSTSEDRLKPNNKKYCASIKMPHINTIINNNRTCVVESIMCQIRIVKLSRFLCSMHILVCVCLGVCIIESWRQTHSRHNGALFVFHFLWSISFFRHYIFVDVCLILTQKIQYALHKIIWILPSRDESSHSNLL